MSDLRRRMMLSNLQKPTDEYIQDGLIFELDGTDKQATGNYVWVDKVGGKGFTNNGGVVELSNGFYFNGTSTSILTCTQTLYVDDVFNCTIEVVIYPRLNNAWAPIFSPTDWNNRTGYVGISMDVRASAVPYDIIKYCTRGGTSHQAYKANNNQLSVYSLFYNSPIYENKNKITTYTMNSSGAFSNRSKMYVGGRIDGSNIVTFNGDIHAIRVYNRILTEEEVLHNQSIDILKYNIEI